MANENKTGSKNTGSVDVPSHEDKPKIYEGTVPPIKAPETGGPKTKPKEK